MRSVAMWLMASAIALTAGCTAAPPKLRDSAPEIIAGPPEDDPRYSNPVEYPKELLNRPPIKPTSPNGLPKNGFKGVGQGF